MVTPFRKIRRVIFRQFQIDTTPYRSESLVSHGVARLGHSFNRTVVGLYTNTINNPENSYSYYTFPAGPFIVGQGADGFSFLVKDLEGIQAFAAHALIKPHLRVEDDLWISAFLLKAGIKVRSLQHTIPGGGTVYTAVHDLNQLRHVVGDLSRETAMTEGIRHLLESGMMGRRRQLAALTKNAILSFLGRT